MKISAWLLIGAIGLALATDLRASVITSYDVTNAMPSGFGGFNHNYAGQIVFNENGTANYSGGSGTLNDGRIPSDSAGGLANNQLFVLSLAPTVTLHLESNYSVSSVTVFGGYLDGNPIPGTLTGWSVSVDPAVPSVAFRSRGFNAFCYSGDCDDVVRIAGSGLEFISTNTVVLSGFAGGNDGRFTIGEIRVEGTRVVPEPGTGMLVLTGLALLGKWSTRREKVGVAA